MARSLRLELYLQNRSRLAPWTRGESNHGKLSALRPLGSGWQKCHNKAEKTFAEIVAKLAGTISIKVFLEALSCKSLTGILAWRIYNI